MKRYCITIISLMLFLCGCSMIDRVPSVELSEQEGVSLGVLALEDALEEELSDFYLRYTQGSDYEEHIWVESSDIYGYRKISKGTSDETEEWCDKEKLVRRFLGSETQEVIHYTPPMSGAEYQKARQETIEQAYSLLTGDGERSVSGIYAANQSREGGQLKVLEIVFESSDITIAFGFDGMDCALMTLIQSASEESIRVAFTPERNTGWEERFPDDFADYTIIE